MELLATAAMPSRCLVLVRLSASSVDKHTLMVLEF
jgi:hypothetical protein